MRNGDMKERCQQRRVPGGDQRFEGKCEGLGLMGNERYCTVVHSFLSLNDSRGTNIAYVYVVKSPLRILEK